MQFGIGDGKNRVIGVGAVAMHADASVESLVHFGVDVIHGPKRQWHLDQIRPFLENPDAKGPLIVAQYYPQVMHKNDVTRWHARQISYGILELSAGAIGDEWPTFPAHIHRGPGRTFLPSVIEVINGRGGLYLQRPSFWEREQESRLIWIEPQNRILLPPGFVHAIFNRGDEPLVVAEAHSLETGADFTEAARRRGLAHYFGPGGARPNPHYHSLPRMREIAASEMAPSETPGKDLYHAILARSKDRFGFLHPF